MEIIRDILEVIKNKSGKVKPTHILYKSNLSHQMMELYLMELKEKELITQGKLGNGKTYFITQKGIDYLSQYRMISEFTQSFGLAE
ncbi:MAG: winged helix-turn-helix domain-containing protein [Nanoarchaeota archaeon]